MGSEYSIRLDQADAPVTPEMLEAIVSRLPDYHGKSVVAGNVLFDFRGRQTKQALAGPPDVNVATSGHDITLCQFGDYAIAAQVLGTIAMELVSESKFERIEVVKP